MSFVDRIRAWFKGETKRPQSAPNRHRPSRGASKELEEFVTSRGGVEGYIEPKTAIYSTTLLLVAADGEYLRRPVQNRTEAKRLCDRHEVPLYDAAIVGYPKRMRDYDRGVRRDEVSLDDLPPWPGDGDAEEPPDGAA